MNGLAILLGPPGALDAELQSVQPMPALPDIVQTGIPSTLARRRPDVREAEANLHAATAQIGVSVAELFPSFTLSGQFGLRNSESNWLTDWSSHFYSLARRFPYRFSRAVGWSPASRWRARSEGGGAGLSPDGTDGARRR